MPEGPELKHSCDILNNIILNKHISLLRPTQVGRYRNETPDGFQEITKFLPLQVNEIRVKGKFMWWELTSNTTKWYLWCTYGMSGQWSLVPTQHSGFIVEFEGGILYFNDPRRFGTLKFVSSPQEHKNKLSSLGPDILVDNPRLTHKIFAERLLKKPKRSISDALLDQSCVSGVGNYIRAEALYRARINPHKETKDLRPEEYVRLCDEVLKIAKESYESQGASLHTYRTVSGELGRQQFKFEAYGQKTCPVGHIIVREPSGNGRTIHWCRTCQV